MNWQEPPHSDFDSRVLGKSKESIKGPSEKCVVISNFLLLLSSSSSSLNKHIFYWHFQLGHNLSNKAHRSRHRCVNCGPSEENQRNNEPWIFHIREALKEHSLAAHKDYVLCNVCENVIEKDVTDCDFLNPREPSCGRIFKD